MFLNILGFEYIIKPVEREDNLLIVFSFCKSKYQNLILLELSILVWQYIKLHF